MRRIIPTCLLVLLALVAFAQAVSFPEAKPYYSKEIIEVHPQFQPTAFLIKLCPKMQSTGEYDLYIDKWNSKAYPAVKFSNTQNISIPGKAIICFPTENIQEVEESTPQTVLNKLTAIPSCNDVADKKFWAINTDPLIVTDDKKAYRFEPATEPKLKTVEVQQKKITLYNIANYHYKNFVTSLFEKKGAASPTVLPIACTNLYNIKVNPADILFEFGIDKIKESYSVYNKTLRKTVDGDGAVLYHLTVHDASGRVLKTYYQTVFVTAKGGKHTYTWEKILKPVYYSCTWQSGFESLLNQFTADAEIAKQINICTTALRIEAVSDTTNLALFKQKNTAAHYRRCMQSSIDVLKQINDEIVSRGGAGLDLSGVQMPANTSAYVSTSGYAIASSTVAAAAGITAIIVNSVNQSEITKLQAEANEIKLQFEDYKKKEATDVQKFNALIDRIPERQIISGDDTEAFSSTAKKPTSANDFWEDGTTAKATTKQTTTKTYQRTTPVDNGYTYTATQKKAYNTNSKTTSSKTDDFWGEGTAANSNTKVPLNTAQPFKYIISSDELLESCPTIEDELRTMEAERIKCKYDTSCLNPLTINMIKKAISTCLERLSPAQLAKLQAIKQAIEKL